MSQTLLPPPADEAPPALGADPVLLRRGPLLVTGLLAVLGGAMIYCAPLPALWRMSWLYGLLFLALGAAQVSSAAGVLVRPVRPRLLLAAAAALAVLTLWVLTRGTGVLPGPDPWASVDSVIGFTDYVCAGLQVTGLAVLGSLAGVRGMAARGLRPRRSGFRRVLATAAVMPLTLAVLLGTLLGVLGASDGFAGAGVPAGTVDPDRLPAGARSTVEYCRPDGVPLAMDLYTPPPAASAGRAAPVAMYIHGGGLVLGDRKTSGLGAALAEHEAALFTPLQRQLNARGFVVASIDYRLTPAAPWPSQLEDAKCAVRFLRAHAADLGVDPARIGVWGASGGGQLSSMLGLTGGRAGFDRGQYLEHSSAVQAVVDMFGPTDFTDFHDAPPFIRFLLSVGIGNDIETRRSASPDNYITVSAPPFLILHGAQDQDVPPRQSRRFADHLRAAGVPATLIEVHGTGHTLATTGQQPSPGQLTDTVRDFFVTTLG